MRQETIVGNPVVLVVDIFESDFSDDREFSHAIPSMADSAPRMQKAADFVKKARDMGLPIVVIHEIHRPDLIDFGRELDGSEGVHCIQDPDNPQLPVKGIAMTDKDYVVYKRRYSAFYATDLDILLKGLKADTLILVGGMTDVCVQYTFVDGHQGDYYCRTLSDCVSGTSQPAHDAALNAMEYLQEGSVMSSEEMLEVLTNRQA